MSSADLLSTYSDRLSAQKRQERLMSIIAQVRHLDRMLDEIGILLHANRAFLSYRPVMTDLAMFCQMLSAEASSVMPPSHQLEVNTAFTDRYISFDPDLMRHALMNLLSNAIKYSPRGGIVALSVQQTDSGYEFSVRDQGIGIPPDEQARMFMPFERASNVGTIRGTGLGLSIVQEVAELHNGSIRLESEVGVGSVFTLIIPIK
jgi:signal transduction histidine kinase